MRTLFASALFTMFLCFGVAAYGQEPGQGTPSRQPKQREQSQAQKTSVTGCLAKGSEANQYTITDQQSHETVSFPGPAQLDKYVNQTVKLTGNMVDDGNGRKVFQPDSINAVSPSC